MLQSGEAHVEGDADPSSDEIQRLCRMRGADAGPPLPEHVVASWKRCLSDYQLAPDLVPRATVLTHAEMRAMKESSEDLLRIAEPEIERLFLQLVDSDYLVSFASPNGVMLLFRCDYPCLGEMSSFGVLPGSVWTEERQGTNGIGTCLRVGKPVTIVGQQHFGVATTSLTCLTAPVLGSRGMVESVINATTSRGADERMNRVVLGIVERASRRIESRYFGRRYRNHLQLRLAANAESADPADEGRLALDDEGRVLAGNSQIAAWLGTPVDQLVGRSIEDLLELGQGLRALRPGAPATLNLRDRMVQAVLSTPERTAAPVGAIAGYSPMLPVPAPVRSAETARAELRIDPITAQSLDRAEKLLRAALPLIVVGETGTGKTAFAETAVRRALGADVAAVVVDGSAPFGSPHLASALSTAMDEFRPCIILDRLEELSREAQGLLLTFLESFDARRADRLALIATTTADPDVLTRENRVRSDLMHRLKGGCITLPPLRNHPDLDAVIAEMLELEQRSLGRTDVTLESTAQLVLAHYHWPGNIRELRKVLRHGLALAERGLIGLEHLPEDLVAEIAKKDLTARSQSEASRIEAALRFNNGNVSLTAKYLGVSRATLYRKIEIQKLRGDA